MTTVVNTAATGGKTAQFDFRLSKTRSLAGDGYIANSDQFAAASSAAPSTTAIVGLGDCSMLRKIAWNESSI